LREKLAIVTKGGNPGGRDSRTEGTVFHCGTEGSSRKAEESTLRKKKFNTEDKASRALGRSGGTQILFYDKSSGTLDTGHEGPVPSGIKIRWLARGERDRMEKGSPLTTEGHRRSNGGLERTKVSPGRGSQKDM